MKRNLLKIAYTALMLALLIVVQLVTKSFGQVVTGSFVNFVLMISALIFGVYSSAIIALISPFLAFILGIGTPIIQIVPFIALGNLVYVLFSCFFIKKNKEKRLSYLIIIIASVIKFFTLYLLIVKIILPTLSLPTTKVSALTIAFSWTQLVTALIGGISANYLYKRIKK